MMSYTTRSGSQPPIARSPFGSPATVPPNPVALGRLDYQQADSTVTYHSHKPSGPTAGTSRASAGGEPRSQAKAHLNGVRPQQLHRLFVLVDGEETLDYEVMRMLGRTSLTSNLERTLGKPSRRCR